MIRKLTFLSTIGSLLLAVGCVPDFQHGAEETYVGGKAGKASAGAGQIAGAVGKGGTAAGGSAAVPIGPAVAGGGAASLTSAVAAGARAIGGEIGMTVGVGGAVQIVDSAGASGAGQVDANTSLGGAADSGGAVSTGGAVQIGEAVNAGGVAGTTTTTIGVSGYGGFDALTVGTAGTAGTAGAAGADAAVDPCPLGCEDGNICTTDRCLSNGTCVHENNTRPCDDGNLCTVGDACLAGACVSGPAPSCDDGNGCTDDSCSPGVGCKHQGKVLYAEVVFYPAQNPTITAEYTGGFCNGTQYQTFPAGCSTMASHSGAETTGARKILEYDVTANQIVAHGFDYTFVTDCGNRSVALTMPYDANCLFRDGTIRGIEDTYQVKSGEPYVKVEQVGGYSTNKREMGKCWDVTATYRIKPTDNYSTFCIN